MTVRRREIITIGWGTLLGAVPLQRTVAAAVVSRHEEEALIDDFRKAVRGLRKTTPGNIPPPSDLGEVRRLGRALLERGIQRIIPIKPGDRACNHWLADIQTS